MKRSVLYAWLPLVLLMSSGCALKQLKAHANSMESLAVTNTMAAPVATVSFGDLALPDETTNVVAIAETAAANVTIDIFEVQMGQRLNEEVNATNLSNNTSRAASQRLDKRGPLPSVEEGGYRMDLVLQGWGLSASTTDPAQAWTSLGIEVYAPAGERIWRKSISCAEPLAANTLLNGVTQMTVSIGTVTAMSEEDLKKTYRELARVCARDAVDTFAGALAKAKAKANKG